MSSDATGLFVAMITAIIVIAALRSGSMAIRLMGGFIWFLPIAYLLNSPPASMPAGSSALVIAIVVMVGIGLIMLFWAFTRTQNITSSFNKNGENRSVSSESNGFHLPNWLKDNVDYSGAQRQKRMQNLDEYRARVHKAIYAENYRPKKRTTTSTKRRY